MTPVIETKRLVLRPPCTTDAESIVRHLNNFAVAGNLSRVPYPYRRADADRWLAQQRSDLPPEETQFAIAFARLWPGTLPGVTPMASASWARVRPRRMRSPASR